MRQGWKTRNDKRLNWNVQDKENKTLTLCASLLLLSSPHQVSGADRFRGPLHCLMETLKKEGPRALYKGKKRKQNA